MRNIDYAANFDDFLGQVKKDQPFCFWLGTSEPHRGYELGAGKRTGKSNALSGNSVKCRSVNYRITVRSSVCIGLIIRYAKEDVGRGIRG